MILLIDNYDSFVFNIKQYIEDSTGQFVHTVRNDCVSLEEIKKLMRDAVASGE